jgi:hypothetical protein
VIWRAVDRRTALGPTRTVYSDKARHSPLPTRLMAGLSIKHMHDLSDEDLCARWVENPCYQLFCGEEFFRRKLTFDRSGQSSFSSARYWRRGVGSKTAQGGIWSATRVLRILRRTGAPNHGWPGAADVVEHRGGTLSSCDIASRRMVARSTAGALA